MGNSETDAPAKVPKTTAAQEQPSVSSTGPATAVYPDWAFQAYSPIPPPGFFHSAVASNPPPPPYVWGAQHLIPPYGTPPPYVMYPHGGIYAHPSMAPGSHPFSSFSIASPNGNVETSGAVPGSLEAEVKSSEGKEKSPIKRSRGSLGSLNMITGKNGDLGKTSGTSGNGAYSQSGDSGSEASSEGSDANSQNDSSQKAGDAQNPSDAAQQNGNVAYANTADGSQNGAARASSQPMIGPVMSLMQVPISAAPGGAAVPTTNLNIGMDFWGATNPATIASIRGKVPSSAVAAPIVPSSSSELWIQDERELKRQRRKQSNRESARRSRLRKQAECEELAHRVEVLKEENGSLRAELNRIKKEYEQLLSQNTSLKESLGEIPKGTEELIRERVEKPSEDDGLKKNANSDGQGREADIAQL
ncbi:hypothetical protein HPP92_008853 [Vanilla planifolia]|uniref:BZIP domain-containing protein n=1 Tax=Vanilla planifolia TaxID=51239 RepID=A0A835V6U1_VANPL|nr:hypothetical protein HPP92_008853 [Vanilla planifolia]